jgi:K+-sensing histidine kinase KdpD
MTTTKKNMEWKDAKLKKVKEDQWKDATLKEDITVPVLGGKEDPTLKDATSKEVKEDAIEDNTDEAEWKDTVSAPDKDSTVKDAQVGKFGKELRHRGPSSRLSAISQKYDVDGDGKLDDAEQRMRDMDTDNAGHLSNEKVYSIMLEQMKLQKEVFSLKRLSMVFLGVMVILSFATLATSFAAATLAKDTVVKNGVLVKKDGGGTIATSDATRTFMAKSTLGIPHWSQTCQRCFMVQVLSTTTFPIGIRLP